MAVPLKIYNESTVKELCSGRAGELKAWQSMALLDARDNIQQALADAVQFGMRFVLLGICEDIGPRANLGKGGAQYAWPAFLQRFLNQPHNDAIAMQKVLLLGEVNLDDLMQQAQPLDNQNPLDLDQLRQLCAEIDVRVEAILNMIFKAGLEPIIIGGGHNNCLGIIRALAKHNQNAINAINLDPHADFRECEGRHSGNGFSYAYQEQLLNNYHVIGLHELKNNQPIFDAMQSANFSYTSYQTINVKREINLTEATAHALKEFDNAPLGVEVDLDSLTNMPASAFNYCGFDVSDGEHYVYLAASDPRSAYLHLCEAAPSQHPHSIAAGNLQCGQVISALVNTYLQTKLSL